MQRFGCELQISAEKKRKKKKKKTMIAVLIT